MLSTFYRVIVKCTKEIQVHFLSVDINYPLTSVAIKKGHTPGSKCMAFVPIFFETIGNFIDGSGQLPHFTNADFTL